MEYKWKAFSVTSVGGIMAAIDSTIVLLALLPIARDLKTDYVTIIWVVVAYLLANTALVLSLGRVADIYGRKRMYNIGFVVFTIGSLLSGLAFSGISLVGFRALQGVGAALLTANSFAILSEAFPRNERGKAFGMNSIVWGTGSILGIVLGGLIITFTSWRVIFLINVPIGIFGTVWAYRTLHESKASDFREESVDIPAAILFTLTLMALLVGITWGLLYGWGAQWTIAFLALSPVLFVSFLFWEANVSKDPIIPLEFFKNRTFTFSIISALLQSLALFSVNFLLIFYLEGIGGFSVLTASYLIVPMAVASSIVGPFAGLLTDRIGARYVASAGLAIQATVLFLLSRLTVSTPLIDVALLEAGFGVGGGLFWPANTSAIMSAAPHGRFGAASGIMNTLRNTGMVMSFALTLTALTSAIPSGLVYALFVGNFSGSLPHSAAISYLSGQSFAFEISVVLLLLCVVFSLFRGSAHPPPVNYSPSQSSQPAATSKPAESL
jgi:EmrB/QacA subfamily drug resistance transporter